ADLGHLAEAEAVYRATIRLQPESDAAYYNLGTVLEAQGRLDDAEAAYREALRLYPEFPAAHCNLGSVLLRSGRYAEALAERRRGQEQGTRRDDWRFPSGGGSARPSGWWPSMPVCRPCSRAMTTPLTPPSGWPSPNAATSASSTPPRPGSMPKRSGPTPGWSTTAWPRTPTTPPAAPLSHAAASR